MKTTKLNTDVHKWIDETILRIGILLNCTQCVALVIVVVLLLWKVNSEIVL